MRRAELKQLSETRSSAALLCRLANTARGTAESLAVTDVLSDLLEGALAPVESDTERFEDLLERGEIGAARMLLELDPSIDQGEQRIRKATAERAQEILRVRRRILGALGQLRGVESQEYTEGRARFEALEKQTPLRENRPGRYAEQLDPIADMLETRAHEEMESLVAAHHRLRATPAENEHDLTAALNRAQERLGSLETLAEARRYLAIAERAAEGRLGNQDLEALYSETPGSERCVRAAADFDTVEPPWPQGLLALLASKGNEEVRLTPAQGRVNALQKLLRHLPRKGAPLRPEAIGRALLGYLGLAEAPTASRKTSHGWMGAVRLRDARIPALADGTFPDGVRLLVPRDQSEVTYHRLIEQGDPKRALNVLYFPGAATRRLRQQLGLPYEVAHIDNIDLLRLVEVPEVRAEHAFQQIVLPRSTLERLKPFRAGGPVAQQMFRGRADVISRLRRPGGGTVLFSGRMMGKSSILHKIHREVEAERAAKETDHHAILIPSAPPDLTKALVDEIAQRVGGDERHRILEEDERLSPKKSDSRTKRRERAKNRLQALRDLLLRLIRDRRWKITLLVDEADAFAESDDSKEPDLSLAWMLRGLEFGHQESLRIVFAGFQSIHRQVIANNGAFANWFNLVDLGPMSEPEATALIREPLADLGFVFASDAGVRRIQEFAGRHPLLLQETCKRLMDRVAARRGAVGAQDLVTIQAADVEAVCLDDQLRSRVRQVLSLNLDQVPKLKLLVYMIVWGNIVYGDSFALEGFRLEDLKRILIEQYSDRLSSNFDDQAIGILTKELEALGLLQASQDEYRFTNRTFAEMLRADPDFESVLDGLLDEVTNPDRAQTRRIPTLETQSLDRLHRDQEKHLYVVGLASTMRSSIARHFELPEHPEGEGGSRRYAVLSGRDAATEEALTARLASALKEERRRTLANLLVQGDFAKLVVDDADDLAESGALEAIAGQLQERNLRLVALGGAPLARLGTQQMATDDFDVLATRRLRPKDIQAWGANPRGHRRGITAQIDDAVSRRLRRVTGGYFPLVEPFLEFAHRKWHGQLEVIPELRNVEEYAEQLKMDEMRAVFLGSLKPEEEALLRALHEVAKEERAWEMDFELLNELVLVPHATRTERSLIDVQDDLEVLELLDLVEARTQGGRRNFHLDEHGPLRRVLDATPS